MSASVWSGSFWLLWGGHLTVVASPPPISAAVDTFFISLLFLVAFGLVQPKLYNYLSSSLWLACYEQPVLLVQEQSRYCCCPHVNNFIPHFRQLIAFDSLDNWGERITSSCTLLIMWLRWVCHLFMYTLQHLLTLSPQKFYCFFEFEVTIIAPPPVPLSLNNSC